MALKSISKTAECYVDLIVVSRKQWAPINGGKLSKRVEDYMKWEPTPPLSVKGSVGNNWGAATSEWMNLSARKNWKLLSYRWMLWHRNEPL